jgi:Cof subfamily protein (haloacid dehalogenase superfamily)
VREVPVRLIATDLDGTLLRTDGSVSAFTRETLARARDAGITVVFVSARGPNGVRAVADEAQVDGLAICSNGAVVIDLGTGETVKHRALAAEVALDVVRELRKRLPDVTFATETESQFALESGFQGAWDDWQPPEGTRYGDALELVVAPVTKLIARDPVGPNARLAEVTADVVGDRAAVSMAGEWVVEINVAGVNKGAALEELAAELGVAAEEVVAFGDYPNDLPMLAWAGTSIAPANAHPDVLAAVDETTAPNDEDGVALAIEQLLPS